MNFEIKSTFIKHKQHMEASRVRYYLGALGFNLLSSSVIVGLYLSNHLLPAAIISKPHGLDVFILASLAIAVKISGGILHAVVLLTKYDASFRRWAEIPLLRLRASVRSSQRYLYAAWCRLPNQTQKL